CPFPDRAPPRGRSDFVVEKVTVVEVGLVVLGVFDVALIVVQRGLVLRRGLIVPGALPPALTDIADAGIAREIPARCLAAGFLVSGQLRKSFGERALAAGL